VNSPLSGVIHERPRSIAPETPLTIAPWGSHERLGLWVLQMHAPFLACTYSLTLHLWRGISTLHRHVLARIDADVAKITPSGNTVRSLEPFGPMAQ